MKKNDHVEYLKQMKCGKKSLLIYMPHLSKTLAGQQFSKPLNKQEFDETIEFAEPMQRKYIEEILDSKGKGTGSIQSPDWVSTITKRFKPYLLAEAIEAAKSQNNINNLII